jgi:hypothetical protein
VDLALSIAALLKDNLERALDRVLGTGLLAETPTVPSILGTIVPQRAGLTAVKDRTLVRHLDRVARAGLDTLAATGTEL